MIIKANRQDSGKASSLEKVKIHIGNKVEACNNFIKILITI